MEHNQEEQHEDLLPLEERVGSFWVLQNPDFNEIEASIMEGAIPVHTFTYVDDEHVVHSITMSLEKFQRIEGDEASLIEVSGRTLVRGEEVKVSFGVPNDTSDRESQGALTISANS